MEASKQAILLVEDDPEVVRLNSRLLARRGFLTETAVSAAEARALIAERRFDLVILDVNLPDGSGYNICRGLRAAGQQDLPVIFLTGRGQTADKVEGLGVGGDYYLVKPYSFDELFAVIQSLLTKTERTRKQITEATVLTRGPLMLQIPSIRAYVNGRDAGLTPKEFAVLLLLMQNEDKELSGDLIYESIWGTAANHDTGALRQHISRLKKKLGEENADDFSILYEKGWGYTFTTK